MTPKFDSLRLVPPRLSERDRLVLAFVARFRQATAAQLAAAVFGLPHQHSSVKRVLARLVRWNCLARAPRFIGGDGGGSGQFVYVLGTEGRKALQLDGRAHIPRQANLHTLSITQAYVELLEAEASGMIRQLTFTTEPDCHRTVHGIKLTPDAHVSLAVPGARVSCWLEVDTGSESTAQLREKCSRYWQAYKIWTEPTIPRVLFVVPDDARKREVERVIRAGPEEAHALFSACQMAGLAMWISRL